MHTIKQILILLIITILFSCSGSSGGENTIVSIKTTLGDIKVKLYNETPLHRDNFIKLVNSGFYEGISFHRVINGFMIQAGDPLTKAVSASSETDSLISYTLPSEFNRNLYHKRGALAAARQANEINPAMRSSGTQFYIVQGEIQTESDLFLAEQSINVSIKQGYFSKIFSEISDSLKKAGSNLTSADIQELASLRLYDLPEITQQYRISQQQIKDYTTIGGVPRLDGTYTVFGEVIEGIETVDKIASSPTNADDKPLSDIKILKAKILK